MSKNVFKSIRAIVVGFLTVAVLSTVTDAILENSGFFPSFEYQMKYGPPTWVLVWALIYRSIYTIAGGYITAMLAPNNPMKHVKILGIIGLVAAVVGVIVGWNLSQHWYPIALAVTAYPLVWFGGKVYKTK